MELLRKIYSVMCVLLCGYLMQGIAFAQDGVGATSNGVNWNEALAILVNSVLVFVGVQLVKSYGPDLSGTVKQVLALAGGPVLMMFAQPALSDLLGFPIDFSLLAAALAGLVSSAVAMGAYDRAVIAGGNK